MSKRDGAWKHDKSAIRVASKCANALCNFSSITHAGRYQPYAERWCGSLNRAQICSPCRIGRIKNHRNSVNTGRAFLKQLQPLPPDRKLEIGEASDIALRPCQVGDEAGRDRIDNLHKNDRYRESLLPQGGGSKRAGGKHHVRAQFNQLGCEHRGVPCIGVAKAKVDLDVAAIDPAQFLQALYQLPDQGLPFWIALREHTQKSDARHRAGLLRARRERPRRRAAEQREGLAAFHSRTSLARAINTSDKETPSSC